MGLWLDARWGGGRRYTISLMVAGLAVGMHNVWRWLRLQEEAEAGQEETDPGPTTGTGRRTLRKPEARAGTVPSVRRTSPGHKAAGELTGARVDGQTVWQEGILPLAAGSGLGLV